MNRFPFVFIDGSFVTDKTLPKDVDVTLELPPASPEVLKIFLASRVFDRTFVKGAFHVDVLPTFGPQDFRQWFQKLRPEEAHLRGLKAGDTKGILRMSL